MLKTVVGCQAQYVFPFVYILIFCAHNHISVCWISIWVKCYSFLFYSFNIWEILIRESKKQCLKNTHILTARFYSFCINVFHRKILVITSLSNALIFLATCENSIHKLATGANLVSCVFRSIYRSFSYKFWVILQDHRRLWNWHLL